MKGNLARKRWGLGVAFLVGGSLVFLATFLAKKGVSEGTIGKLLNKIYSLSENHIWEILAGASLAAGIWFSMARRRVVLSVLCLFLAFLFSLVLPNFF